LFEVAGEWEDPSWSGLNIRLGETKGLPERTALMAGRRFWLNRDVTTWAEPPAPIPAFMSWKLA
jgi:hypothetical protein